MSDSINEQRCDHGYTSAHRRQRYDHMQGERVELPRCPGPSVVTPPAQDEQPPRTEWNIGDVEHCNAVNPSNGSHCTLPPTVDAHRSGIDLIHRGAHGGDPTRWCVTARPAAPSVSTDHTDDKEIHMRSARREDGWPTRSYIRYDTDAERLIRIAMQLVEGMGASDSLTSAVVALDAARTTSRITSKRLVDDG